MPCPHAPQVLTYPRLRCHGQWWPTDTLKEQAVDHIHAPRASFLPLQQDSEGISGHAGGAVSSDAPPHNPAAWPSGQSCSKLDWPILTQVVNKLYGRGAAAL